MLSARKLKTLSSSYQVIIFILLLLFWFVMTLLFIINYQDKFFTLVSRHRDVFLNQNQELLKGKVLKGSFYATQDNMGIVSILFNSHNHIVYDTVRFRIKEKNSKQWYYESDYNTAAFFLLPLYPFSFPII